MTAPLTPKAKSLVTIFFELMLGLGGCAIVIVFAAVAIGVFLGLIVRAVMVVVG